MKRPLEQTHIVLGFPGVNTNHPDRYASFLLNTYLGGGMSSALFQEIREKRGLAYTIYSSLAPFSDTGLFSIYAGTSPEEVDTCLDVMGREFARLREEKLNESSLEILKDNLKGTILLGSDSVENRMMSIAKNEMFFGRYVPVAEVMRKIDDVSASDLQRIARQLFKPRQLILSLLGPKSVPSAGRKVAKHL